LRNSQTVYLETQKKHRGYPRKKGKREKPKGGGAEKRGRCRIAVPSRRDAFSRGRELDGPSDGEGKEIEKRWQPLDEKRRSCREGVESKLKKKARRRFPGKKELGIEGEGKKVAWASPSTASRAKGRRDTKAVREFPPISGSSQEGPKKKRRKKGRSAGVLTPVESLYGKFGRDLALTRANQHPKKKRGASRMVADQKRC